MRIALFADIHSNLEALQACLQHAVRQDIQQQVFLGDIVGYGADPLACTGLIAEAVERGALAVLGNHDQAVLGGLCEHMNFHARDAVYWTRGQLGPAEKAFLATLPLSLEQEGRLYVHAEASQPDAWHYVTSARAATRSLAATEAGWTFAGHVHHPILYFNPVQDGQAKLFLPSPGQAIPLLASRRWLAIVGSVGQPRDENPAAAYALLDTEQRTLTFQRVAYDHVSASAKILAAGLPERLAYRLQHGH